MSGWYGERDYNRDCYGGYPDEAHWAEDNPEGYRSYCRLAGDTWAQEKGAPKSEPATAIVEPSGGPLYAPGARVMYDGQIALTVLQPARWNPRGWWDYECDGGLAAQGRLTPVPCHSASDHTQEKAP